MVTRGVWPNGWGLSLTVHLTIWCTRHLFKRAHQSAVHTCGFISERITDVVVHCALPRLLGLTRITSLLYGVYTCSFLRCSTVEYCSMLSHISVMGAADGDSTPPTANSVSDKLAASWQLSCSLRQCVDWLTIPGSFYRFDISALNLIDQKIGLKTHPPQRLVEPWTFKSARLPRQVRSIIKTKKMMESVLFATTAVGGRRHWRNMKRLPN